MFIVLEGPDGRGKTTLAHALAEHLNHMGLQVLYTFEPTVDSEYGHEIRRLLQGEKTCDPVHISDLMTADRKYHLEMTILPALTDGQWVVCDRYKYSALAYQQMQGVDAQYLIESNRKYRVPDAIFILQPRTVSILLERIVQRSKRTEYFEKAHFLEGVLEFYNKMTAYFPDENIRFLDAELSTPDLIEEIIKCLHDDGFLNDKR